MESELFVDLDTDSKFTLEQLIGHKSIEFDDAWHEKLFGSQDPLIDTCYRLSQALMCDAFDPSEAIQCISALTSFLSEHRFNFKKYIDKIDINYLLDPILEHDVIRLIYECLNGIDIYDHIQRYFYISVINLIATATYCHKGFILLFNRYDFVSFIIDLLLQENDGYIQESEVNIVVALNNLLSTYYMIDQTYSKFVNNFMSIQQSLLKNNVKANRIASLIYIVTKKAIDLSPENYFCLNFSFLILINTVEQYEVIKYYVSFLDEVVRVYPENALSFLSFQYIEGSALEIIKQFSSGYFVVMFKMFLHLFQKINDKETREFLLRGIDFEEVNKGFESDDTEIFDITIRFATESLPESSSYINMGISQKTFVQKILGKLEISKFDQKILILDFLSRFLNSKTGNFLLEILDASLVADILETDSIPLLYSIINFLVTLINFDKKNGFPKQRDFFTRIEESGAIEIIRSYTYEEGIPEDLLTNIQSLMVQIDTVMS